MGALAIFVRTLRTASAISLGATLAILHPVFDWAPSRAAAHKSPREAAVDGLLAALHDNDSAVRWTAALALGDVQSPYAVSVLTKDLESADAVIRARAACGLRAHGEGAAAAIDPLVRLLADGTAVDASVCGRKWWRSQLTTPGEQSAAALVAIGERAFEPVLQSIRRPEWNARRNAAWALGMFRKREAVPALLEALKDSNERVRAQAAWALGMTARSR
jgi:HEAT repeat protein